LLAIGTTSLQPDYKVYANRTTAENRGRGQSGLSTKGLAGGVVGVSSVRLETISRIESGKHIPRQGQGDRSSLVTPGQWKPAMQGGLGRVALAAGVMSPDGVQIDTDKCAIDQIALGTSVSC